MNFDIKLETVKIQNMKLEQETKDKIKELIAQGKTQRQIAEHLSLNLSKVNRTIAKMKRDNEQFVVQPKTRQPNKIKNETNKIKNETKKTDPKKTATKQKNETDKAKVKQTKKIPPKTKKRAYRKCSIIKPKYASLPAERKDFVKVHIVMLASRGYPYKSIMQIIYQEHGVTVSADTILKLVNSGEITEERKQNAFLVLQGVPDVPLASVGVRQELLESRLERYKKLAAEAVTEQRNITEQLQQLPKERTDQTTQARSELKDNLKTAKREELVYNKEIQNIINLADKNITNWANTQMKRVELELKKVELKGGSTEDTSENWEDIKAEYKAKRENEGKVKHIIQQVEHNE